MKAANAGVVSFDLTDATLERSKSVSVECSTTLVTYTFTTNPETMKSWDINGCYVMYNGAFEFVTANPKDLSAWRWYMEPSIKDYVYYAKFQFMELDDEDETTGIISTEAEVSKPETIYNLSGQRVANPVKGKIYIINGKKVKY